MTPNRRRRISRSGTHPNRRNVSSRRLVAITVDGETQVHAAGSLYASLCGLDGNDSGAGQSPAPLPPNAKIDCPQCIESWRAWAKFTEEDFV